MATRHETRFVLTAQDRTKAALKSAEGGMRQLDGVATKLAAGFAGLAGVGGLGLLIQRQAEAARSATAYSSALGVGVEQLTAMQFAAESVGIQSDKMADILKDVSEKIADAYVNKGGEAKEALDNLNLSISDMAQLSPDQQLLAIADALANVQTRGEQVQIMEALASDAALLLPLLDGNAEKLKELQQLARDTGAVFTQDEVDRLREADEAMRMMSAATDGLAQSLAVTLAPVLTGIIRKLSVGIPSALESMKSGFDAFWENDLLIRIRDAETDLDDLIAKQIELEQKHGAVINSGVLKLSEYEQVKVEIKETSAEIQKLNAELDSLRNPKQTAPPTIQINEGSGVMGGSSGDNDRLQKQLDSLRDSLMSEEEAIMESYMNRQMIIDDARANQLITEQEELQLSADLHMEYEAKRTAITDAEAKKRADIETNAQQAVDSMKQRSLSLAVGLLQMMGQQNKAAAIAAIALEKGIAIQRVITASATANAAAGLSLLYDPTGVAMRALQAEIAAQKAISIGLIAATGLAQAANVKSGAGGSTLGAPAPAAPVGGSAIEPVRNAATDRQNQITIRIIGDGDFKDLVIKSIESADSNDEITILRDR